MAGLHVARRLPFLLRRTKCLEGGVVRLLESSDGIQVGYTKVLSTPLFMNVVRCERPPKPLCERSVGFEII